MTQTILEITGKLVAVPMYGNEKVLLLFVLMSFNVEHVDTSKYLSMNTKYQFGHPISGQLEIAGTTRITDGEHWIAQEGIYLSSEK
jgi:hypothetical protein